jgi:FixJ family two-component response regulator
MGFRVQAFASAPEFLGCPRGLGPTCLVLDIRLPDLTGLDLQRRLAENGESPPIIFITGHGDIPTTVRAMKAGAMDFLTKPFHEDELLAAIRHALERDQQARKTRARCSAIRTNFASLTLREREVMALVVRGLLNKQISATLGIAEITTKVHRRRVMDKMHAASLPELVRMADAVPQTYTEG